jgi:hypothetical protein
MPPFMELVEVVMAREPYASARRVFWVVDNGSSHRGRTAIDRLTSRYPNAIMVYTPTADLQDLLARIERHEQTEPDPQHQHQPALPTAA